MLAKYAFKCVPQSYCCTLGAGVVIVALVRHIVKLYDRLFEVQEARRLEGNEVAKELNTTLQTFSESTKMLIDKIKIVRGEK